MSTTQVGADQGLSTPVESERLINRIIDSRAEASPDMVYAELPLSPTTFKAGFRKVTYAALANAVNGIAWWLSENLGYGKECATLLYLGPNDGRHNLLLLGAVKTGYKVMPSRQIKQMKL